MENFWHHKAEFKALKSSQFEKNSRKHEKMALMMLAPSVLFLFCENATFVQSFVFTITQPPNNAISGV